MFSVTSQSDFCTCSLHELHKTALKNELPVLTLIAYRPICCWVCMQIGTRMEREMGLRYIGSVRFGVAWTDLPKYKTIKRH